MSLFLHQTTTHLGFTCIILCCICLYSYIKPQLAQVLLHVAMSCICLYSYIKPQLVKIAQQNHTVVYVSIPTSNHNYGLKKWVKWQLYMSLFLHQTTTSYFPKVISRQLYMSLFLHQTTTVSDCILSVVGCICLYSYIKPQQFWFERFEQLLYMSLFLHQTTTPVGHV